VNVRETEEKTKYCMNLEAAKKESEITSGNALARAIFTVWCI
jgi:hypothetical protein